MSAPDLDRDAVLARIAARASERVQAGLDQADRRFVPAPETDPVAIEALEELITAIPEPFDPRVSPSVRPIVGRGLTTARRLAVRAVREPFLRSHAEVVAFDVAAVRALAEMATTIAELRTRIEELEAEVAGDRLGG